ncbi:MAG: SDR family oxidoreductase [Acidobacteria bacterium]|jgi:NAD(P)-dependent dehydrogenase (short-subunit alcohol dehydrogenase family)|nr:SDR family oxidoreductase [Acidobacteriota bacterium]
MGFLDGKQALVTGGSRGIGLAIASALIEEGAEVAICGRDPEQLRRSASVLGARALTFACDVARDEQVAAMFDQVARRFGGLDILVNNAGVGLSAGVADTTPEQWRTVIETNLCGPFYCSRLAIPLMKKRGGGYIINISSLAGKNAFAGGAAYNASKFGLNGFSEALMLDVRYDKIRVSYVMPGSVETEFGMGVKASASDWKLQSVDVAEQVLALLRLPQRALASRVEMRPLLPPRK